jgi:hypothetical protein
MKSTDDSASLNTHETNILKGQSHEKVGKMRVEGDGLGPN